MKLYSSALKEWISAFSEAWAMLTGIATLLLSEFGNVRLQLWDTSVCHIRSVSISVMIKLVLICLWGQHLMQIMSFNYFMFNVL